MKRILLIGNGGREHALADALARSSQKKTIYNFGAVINPGIKKLTTAIQIGDICNPEEVLSYAKKIKPDFAIIGPEDPLAAGVSDALTDAQIPCFAPSKLCAQLESSKSFTRCLLKKYNIDASPDFEVFQNAEDKKNRKLFFQKHNGQIVVKADGLIGGKGVLVAGDHFETFEETEKFSLQSIQKFGKVVFEEKLIGEEFSLISIVDGETVLDTPAIQDHKRAFEGDTGPNTGGMGCVSDEKNSLPFLQPKDITHAHQITVQVMKALQKELDQRYIGVMYGGFILTKNGVKLIEYNARFGDPEALNILPILETDFIDVCEKTIQGQLNEIKKLEFRSQATVVKYLCPEGYPTNPVKDVEIFDQRETFVQKGNEESSSARVFFASVGEENGKLFLKGSRAIGITGIGDSLAQAYEHCESEIQKFKGPLFHRKDIGTLTLLQKRIDSVKKIRESE
jgi:phosphoribosylamine--glycine ligase